jgi:predicted ATPase with chaperone activity
VPASLKETGIDAADLLNLLLKIILVRGIETVSSFSEAIRLPRKIVTELLEQAVASQLLQVLGSMGTTGLDDLRYAFTEKGRKWANETLAMSAYAGPAPVSLPDYSDRILRQKVTNETISWPRIQSAFADLDISEAFIDQIGPAVRSGRATLLYGPAGNGKTSVAQRLGRVFSSVVYIPHAVMIEGQIMRVFDPNLHQPIADKRPVDQPAEKPAIAPAITLRREDFDMRWVPCRRPFVVAGGELTLEMLDLRHEATANFYEAPLHIKASGGCLLIDDFGRQLVSPTALLNRWIVPLENRVDYLSLASGQQFQVPFEQLTMFSTNLDPRDLVDDAFLRRMRHKVEITPPTREIYERIFLAVCRKMGLNPCPEAVDYLFERYYSRNRSTRASDCRDLLETVQSICRFRRVPLQLTRDLMAEAAASFIREFN